MNLLYAIVARRANHRCEYCQAPEAVFNFPFEVEPDPGLNALAELPELIDSRISPSRMASWG